MIEGVVGPGERSVFVEHFVEEKAQSKSADHQGDNGAIGIPIGDLVHPLDPCVPDFQETRIYLHYCYSAVHWLLSGTRCVNLMGKVFGKTKP